MVVFTVMGWTAHEFWLTAISDHPRTILLVAVEAIVLVALSPEVRLPRTMWPHGEMRIVSDCATADVSVSDTLGYLHASVPFHDLLPFLRPEVTDHWREGCWRFVSYAAEYEERAATAIFAVPILPHSGAVRAAVVDDTDGTNLLTVGSVQDDHVRPSFVQSRQPEGGWSPGDA